MIKVSIIMPVYNCEKYLHESLSSIIRQTLSEWELLCIDDGSSDYSLNILKEYCLKDNRIQVYNQKNQGAGIARNFGLQHAKGEFVAFLDADDFFLDNDALDYMYKTCISNQVKACGTPLRIFRNGKIVSDVIFKDIEKHLHEKSVFRYRDFQFDYGYYCFIFERKTLREHNIEFPTYRRFQDPPFFVKAMYVIDKFCFVDKALYCYRAPNAIRQISQSKVEGLLEGLHDNLAFAKEHELTILFNKTVNRIEYEYTDIICHSITEDSIEVLKQLIKCNDLVQEYYGKNYVIQPLYKVLNSVSKVEKRQKEVFINELVSKSSIYIYGAGKVTKDFLAFLRQKGLFHKVKGILVTEKKNNPEILENIAVIELAEYSYGDGDIVIIATSGIYQNDIICKLKKEGVLTYERLNVGVFDNEKSINE